MSIQRDIDAELRFHFESRIDDLVSQGMSREAARAQAVAEFGDVDQVRDGLREIDRRVARRRDRIAWFDALRQDLGYACRTLRQNPTVSLTVILTLALGIGVNAAMFSLLDVIYLRPPAGVVAPSDLRRVWVERRSVEGTQFWPGHDYAIYQSVANSVAGRAEAMLYYGPLKERLSRAENAAVARVVGIDGSYFPLLGVTAARGRLFSADETALGAVAPVAVISDAFWKRQYDADPDVVGRELMLGARRYTVIGVAPAGFHGVDLDATDVWAPIAPVIGIRQSGRPWWQDSNMNGFQVVLRLRPGVNDAALLTPVTNAMRRSPEFQEYAPKTVAAFGAINRERGPGKVSGAMQVATRLAGVAIIVLLIASANVVNLLLARGVRRRREIAVRLALGVSRARLVRFLIAESMLLAMMAGAAAVAAAIWGGRMIQTLLMPEIQWTGNVLHWRVLAFALVGAAATGVLVGLVPAVRMSRPNLIDALKSSAGRAGARSALRDVLVVAQAALSVVLLVGAVLFVRSLSNVKAHDIGYSVDRIAFASASYDTRDSARDAMFADRLRALEPRIAAIAGVSRVAFSTTLPKAGFTTRTYFADVDTTRHPLPWGMWTAVSPNFFAVTGNRLLRGRTFAPDRAGPRSVVVNEAMAAALWPDEEPLGRCIRFEKPSNPCATVIGVVGTALMDDIGERARPQFYLPLDNMPFRTWMGMNAVIEGDPRRMQTVLAGVRELIHREFPGAIPRVRAMSDIMAPVYRPWAVGARLFTLFGTLALVVATIGVYSSVSYAVTQRTHEFGVRLALGATTTNVLGQVLGENLRTVVVGVTAGAFLALAGGRLVRSLLYGVEPNDPLSLAIVATVLVIIALAAAFRPAWRASRCDPVSALRAE